GCLSDWSSDVCSSDLAGMRSATASATALLPEAVGPKTARTRSGPTAPPPLSVSDTLGVPPIFTLAGNCARGCAESAANVSRGDEGLLRAAQGRRRRRLDP